MSIRRSLQVFDKNSADKSIQMTNVAIFGNTIIVGAKGDTENGLDDQTGYGAGAAYIFVKDGATWEQQSKLLAPDGQAGDSFGRRVSIYGDTVVVGAHLDDSSGSAYVFVREGDGWIFQEKLTAHPKPEPSAGRAAKPNHINTVLVYPRPDGCRIYRV